MVLGSFAALLVLFSFPAVAQQEAPMQIGYQERIVSYLGAGVTLGGTLTVPAGAVPRAAVLLLTGSGAQDREYTLSGFALFRTLARGLAERGIASLRADDRGVGSSGGSMTASTLEDFAKDALAGLAELRRLIGVAVPAGLLGHSEGGAVAPLAAAMSDSVEFIVMLGGPGVAVEANILAQTELIGRANALPEAQIRREVELLAAILRVLRASGSVETLRPLFLEKARADVAAMSPEMRRALSDLPRYADVLFRQQMEMMDTRWFRSLVAYDPSNVVPSLACPVLALYGERDLQAPAFINAEGMRAPLEQAGQAASSVRIVAGVNHLFQIAHSGSPAAYPSLAKEFAPGVISSIADWILSLKAKPASEK
jgi:uncharacterized protein